MQNEINADDYWQIDQLCDEFESAWNPESVDLFRSSLRKCPEALRKSAFLELLKVDIELRSRRGCLIDSSDYVARFPEFSDLIDSILSTINPNLETTVGDEVPVIAISATGHNIKSDLAKGFGRFQLRRELGRGSFGSVYLAYDPTLDRNVALKLPRFSESDRERLQRFLEEAQVAAQLHHPNIVAVWERAKVDDQYYICSEYVDGETVESVLKEDGHVSLRTKVTWVRDLAEALSYAHQANVIHRDLKPANLIINEQNRPMIMDFGLAKRLDLEVNQTTDGLILGTPAYMSPEQARGASSDVDRRTDQYSLGVILYELLTEQKLQSGAVHEILLRLQQLPAPPDFSSISNPLPVDLMAVCQKMLQPAVGDRYEDCGDVARDLTNWLEGRPVSVRRISTAERLAKWSHRNPVISGLLAAVLSLLTVGLIVVSILFAVASEARLEAETNLEAAEANEKQAQLERDYAQAAQLAERKEVSRSKILLAGNEIRAGRFQEALELLEQTPAIDRNWVWHIQRTRVPEVVSQFDLPKNATKFGLRAYYDDSGAKLAVTFRSDAGNDLNAFRTRTWLIDVQTSELLDDLSLGYRVTTPTVNAFTKGGRYMVLRLTRELGEIFRTIGIYDTHTRQLVASRGKVQTYVPSVYRSNEVLIQEIIEGKAQYRYIVWDFLNDKDNLVREGGYEVPYNYSTDENSTELCIRKNNWVYLSDVQPENEGRSELLHRLAATHWNVSSDQRYVVGQLQDVWAWNARGLTVSPGQAAVVEFPLKMKTVLEPQQDVAGTLFSYQQNHSQRTDSLETPRGFFISNNNQYALLDMVNALFSNSQKRDLCWWYLESGEYIGKAIGLAVSPTGENYVSEKDGTLIIRKAPFRVKRFRSEVTESVLAELQPIHPSHRNRLYPNLVYVAEQPWVLVAQTDFEDSVSLEKRFIRRKFPKGQSIGHVAVDHKGQRLAFHSRDNKVEIVSTITGNVERIIQLEHLAAREFLTFHPNHEDLVVGDVQGISVWSLKSGKMLSRFNDYPCPHRAWGGIHFSQTGKFVILNNAAQRSVVLETDSWKPVREGPERLRTDYALSSDDRLLAINDGYGTIRIENFADGASIREMSVDSRHVDGLFHPTQPIFIMTRQDGRLQMFDTETWGLLLDESSLASRGTCRFSFSESGNSVAVGLQFGTTRWFEFSASPSPD